VDGHGRSHAGPHIELGKPRLSIRLLATFEVARRDQAAAEALQRRLASHPQTQELQRALARRELLQACALGGAKRACRHGRDIALATADTELDVHSHLPLHRERKEMSPECES
jgi:hypothetical protein